MGLVWLGLDELEKLGLRGESRVDLGMRLAREKEKDGLREEKKGGNG